MSMLKVFLIIQELLEQADVDFNHEIEQEDGFIWVETSEPEKVKGILGMDCVRDYVEDVEVNIFETES